MNLNSLPHYHKQKNRASMRIMRAHICASRGIVRADLVQELCGHGNCAGWGIVRGDLVKELCKHGDGKPSEGSIT